MPRRRLTIATMMFLVVIAGLAAALVRSESRSRADRAELVAALEAVLASEDELRSALAEARSSAAASRLAICAHSEPGRRPR